MKIELSSIENTIDNGIFKFLIPFSILLLFPITLVLGSIGISPKLFVFLAIPIISLIIFDFRMIYLLLIVSLFIPVTFQRLYVSVIFSFIFIISFLLTHKNISLRDFVNPLLFPILLFIVLSLPSLVNSPDLKTSLLLMYNILSILFILILTFASINRVEDITRYLNFFLLLVFIDSISVYYEGLILGIRGFGFGGMMFVDFVGIAIIISFINLIIHSGFKRYLFLTLFLFFIFASLLTQTRTSWVAISSTLGLFLTFFLFHKNKFKLSKKIIPIVIIVLIAFIGTIIFSQKSLTSSIEKRSSNITELKGSFNEEGKATNSLITRSLIWHTAYQAFVQHPIIGIGSYSFPIASQEYYTIPKFLFQDYVEGLTPHQTFIAIITESGIIGFSGFIFFIFVVLKTTFQTVKYATSKYELLTSLLLLWVIIYIVISMFLTDAWLWGPGGIFFGIILGLAMSNQKILISKN